MLIFNSNVRREVFSEDYRYKLLSTGLKKGDLSKGKTFCQLCIFGIPPFSRIQQKHCVSKAGKEKELFWQVGFRQSKICKKKDIFSGSFEFLFAAMRPEICSSISVYLKTLQRWNHLQCNNALCTAQCTVCSGAGSMALPCIGAGSAESCESVLNCGASF